MADTAQLTATVKDSGGSVIPGASTYWTSEDTSIATVDQTGLVTAVAVGTTTIHAISGQASATKTVVVSSAAVPPNPTLGAISPNTAVQGDTALSITVDGLDIPSDATLVFSDSGITVDDVTPAEDGNSLTGHITVADDATVETGTVKIHSDTTGDSGTLPFGVTAMAQTLDHLTMTLSSSSVEETATAPTLTLGQYQTSDTSTLYTDTLSPANAFSSSDTSVATINGTTGVIVLQGPGTTTITRTAGGKTVTAVLTVTAEVLTATPSSLGVTVGAGPSSALVIKDQFGTDVTSGCTFATSDASVATVDSSGVVTYVGVGTCNIVATHTIDGETCTIGVTVGSGAPVIGAQGQNIMGAVSTAKPVQWDAARVYSGSGYASPDAQWRATKVGAANLSANPEFIFNDSSKNGGVTPASSAQYIPGRVNNVDLVSIVPSSTVSGIPAFRHKWVPCDGGSGNASAGQSPPSAQMICDLPSNTRRVWVGRRSVNVKATQLAGAHDWDTTGSECVISANTTYNSTGGGSGAGLKDGPYAQSTDITTARCGVSGLTNATYSGPGTLDGLYQLDGDFEDDGAGILLGFTDQTATQASTIDNGFNDGLIYDAVALCELFSDGTNDWTATRYWRRSVNSDFTVGAWKRVGSYVVASMFDTLGGTGWHNGFTFDQAQWTTKNHNRAIEAPRYRDISEAGAFDATDPNSDGSDDPWGCLAADAATAPAVLHATTFASSTTTTGTFNLTRTTSTSVPSYAAKVRAVIDGVDADPSLDYVVPATVGDGVSFPLTVALSDGNHLAQFKTVSADGTHVSAAYPSVAVECSTSDVPGPPTASNATSETSSTLSFPVTLASSQALPTKLAYRYSIDNATWTAGTDITLSSPTLGEAISATVAVPGASTLYYVQFAEKDSTAESYWSPSVTGTTTSAGVSVPTGLSGVAYKSDDMTGYANTAAIQASSNFGYQYSTFIALATSPLYNSHNVMKVTLDGSSGDAPRIAFSLSTPKQFILARETTTFPSGFVGHAASRSWQIIQSVVSGSDGSGTWDGRTLSQVWLSVESDGHYHLKASASAGGSDKISGQTKDVDCGAVGAEFASGYTVDYLLEHQITSTSGGTWIAKAWIKKLGGTAMLLGTITVVPGLSSQIGAVYWQDGMPNTASQSQYINQVEVIDESAHPDPFGLSAASSYTPLT